MNYRIYLIVENQNSDEHEEVLLSRRLMAPENVDRHLDVIGEFIDLNLEDFGHEDYSIVVEPSAERIWNAQPGRRF